MKAIKPVREQGGFRVPVKAVGYQKQGFRHAPDHGVKPDIKACDLAREKAVADVLSAELDSAADSSGVDDRDLEQIMADAISGASVDDLDEMNPDGTLKVTRTRPVVSPPASTLHSHKQSNPRKLGKYDEVIIAHIRTREPLAVIMRATGRYTEEEIQNAQANKENRIRYLVRNGYIMMRADEIKRQLEAAVLMLATSVRHDADKASDIDLPLKDRREHLQLLKQSIDLLNPVLELISDREKNPHDHARNVTDGQYVDVDAT